MAKKQLPPARVSFKLYSIYLVTRLQGSQSMKWSKMKMTCNFLTISLQGLSLFALLFLDAFDQAGPTWPEPEEEAFPGFQMGSLYSLWLCASASKADKWHKCKGWSTLLDSPAHRLPLNQFGIPVPLCQAVQTPLSVSCMGYVWAFPWGQDPSSSLHRYVQDRAVFQKACFSPSLKITFELTFFFLLLP